MTIRDALLEWRRKFGRGERMQAGDIDALLALVPEHQPPVIEAIPVAATPAVIAPIPVADAGPVVVKPLKPAKATKK